MLFLTVRYFLTAALLYNKLLLSGYLNPMRVAIRAKLFKRLSLDHLYTPSGKSSAGDKYAIMPKGSEMTWLCGFYHLEEEFPHFVILTREPGESIAFIHDRMPFILPEREVDKWIDPNMNPHMMVSSALTDMVFEKEH